MKKLIALSLALCMALTILPALSEGDVTGTWYMQFMGLTAGSIELNADGTAAMIIDAAEGAQTVEAAWTQDGEKISLTYGEQTLPLSWDGENLTLDPEGLAALASTPGMDLSGVSAGGMDMSVMSTLFQLTREPGTLTTAALTAYQTDGTLPEGVTEEEMQLKMMEIMTSLFSVMGSVSGSESNENVDLSEGIAVLEENLIVYDSYGGQTGTYMAKIQNNNEGPAYITDLSLTLKDADGNDVGQSDYASVIGSHYLEPGEITLISISADVSEGAAVADCVKVISATSPSSYQTPDTQLDVTAELRIEEGWSTDYRPAVTVVNNGEAPLTNISCVIAVRDAEGTLLDIATTSLYGAELPAGNTIILVTSVDYNIVNYCSANGIVPAQVEAFASMGSF